MLLSDLTQKPVYVGKTFRGVCLGVAVSLKTYAVKYLLCSSNPKPNSSHADFAVAVSSVLEISDTILLSKLRSAVPRACAKFFLYRPVFSDEGAYLGNISDLELRDFIATQFFTDRGESLPITAIAACSDAVILKKEQPYPLGQRIPAPVIALFTDKPDAVVTKPVLRSAIANCRLLKLTLSLPPFSLDLPAVSNGVFRRQL